MVCTFVTSYVNTAIIPLVTSANFIYAPWPWNLLKINEVYTDMTENWWLKIAPGIVTTTLLQAFVPWISAGVSIIMFYVFKFLDQC